MTKLLLSVLLPTYNRSSMLRQTFDSLLAQTYRGDEFELIVSNDCSKDDTDAVIQEYKNRFTVFSSFSHQANLGGAKNWEFLLLQAKGDFVYMLSDDDAVAPDFFHDYLEKIRNIPNLDLVFSGLELHDAKMKFISDLSLSEMPGETSGVVRLKDQLRSHHMVISAAYRREIFLTAGGWDSTVGTHLDCTAFCRMAIRSRIASYIPKSLLYYRIAPGSWASFSVEKQKKHGAWYRRKLDLLLSDIKVLNPELESFMHGMYLAHAKSMIHSLEIEFSHNRVKGIDVRSALVAIRENFPEVKETITYIKIFIASFMGTWWLKLFRKILGKPNPYNSSLALFGEHSYVEKKN